MSPVRISPKVLAQISNDLLTLEQTEPTMESRVVVGKVFIKPAGADLHHLVELDSYKDDPIGHGWTQRLSSGYNREPFMIVDPDDELAKTVGVGAIEIDKIRYEAVNAVKRKESEP